MSMSAAESPQNMNAGTAGGLNSRATLSSSASLQSVTSGGASSTMSGLSVARGRICANALMPCSGSAANAAIKRTATSSIGVHVGEDDPAHFLAEGSREWIRNDLTIGHARRPYLMEDGIGHA